MAVKKRLYQSKDDIMIAGVCAGIAEYLDVDPTIIRLLWVLLTIGGFGAGILIYIAMAIIVPEDPDGKKQIKKPPSPKQKHDCARFFGLLLVAAGIYLLLVELGMFVVDFSKLLPVILILLGAAFVYRSYS